ncbi:hypothetical protein ACFW04_006851 [Cataglyphis niger]
MKLYTFSKGREKHPGLYPQQCKAAQFCFRGRTEDTGEVGRGWAKSCGGGREGGRGGAVEKDQEPRSGERSERERRQFFKIKAVKPNLQVCRRKRVEVVKILVRRICAHDHLSPSLSLSLSRARSCFSTHPSCLRLSSNTACAAPPTSLASG